MFAYASVHGCAVLPRVRHCSLSAMPGVGSSAPLGCPASFGSLPPGLKWSPWRTNQHPLKSHSSAWTGRGRSTLPIVARLRDRSGNDKLKPDRAGYSKPRPVQPQYKPSSRTVKAPRFKGLNPELILSWLEYAQRGNEAVRITDQLAALNELRSAGLAKDPRFLHLLEQLITQFSTDPGSFTNRALETLARDLAKVGGDVSRCLDQIEGEAVKRLRDLNQRQITGILWACAKAERGDSIFGAADEELVRRGFRGFLPQHISNIVWAFACAGKGQPELFAAVESEVVQMNLGDFTPQGLGNLAWAFAKAGIEASELFAAIRDELMRRRLGDFNPQNLMNLVWAYAASGKEASLLFSAVEEEVLARGLLRFNAQDIANLVWAFATAGNGGQLLFALVERAVVSRSLGGFTEQGLANVAWAFAKAEVEAPGLFAAIGREVSRRRLGEFKPQSLANLVWAFATARREAPLLFAAVDKEVLARGLQGFTEQGITNLVWAFARAEVEAPTLFAAVEAEVVNRGPRHFNAQGMSNLVWAVATSNREAPALFIAAEQEVLGRGLETCSSQNVSNMLLAFASAGKGTSKLFAMAEAWVLMRALRGSALAHAPAGERRGGHFEHVYAALEAGSAGWVKEGVVAQDAANMLWAMAVAKRIDSAAGRVLLVMWGQVVQDVDVQVGLSQVCQYILACVDAQECVQDRYCSGFLQQWRDMATSDQRRPTPSSSDLHREVSAVLQGMGINHENEAPYFHGLLYVDILVDGKVALEVDGPAHFYQDTGAINSVTLFKRRLLERGGFSVVSVPYLEWIALKGQQAKEDYLVRKLQGVF